MHGMNVQITEIRCGEDAEIWILKHAVEKITACK